MAPAMIERPEPSEAAANDGRPARIALPGGAAWINRAALRRAGLPLEPTALAELLAPLIADRHEVLATYKDDHRSSVQQIDLGGCGCVWKRFRVPRPRRLIHQARHLLRLSPAWRNWRGALRLQRADVRTAEPLMLINVARLGAVTSGLLLPLVEGPTLHRYLRQTADATTAAGGIGWRQLALAHALGRQIGHMTACGLVNGDCKPGNLIVDAACLQGDQPPIVIDQSAIRRRLHDRQVVRMLATLLRTARRTGPIDTRLALTCLKAVRAADPSVAHGLSLTRLARRILAMAKRRQAT